MSHIVRFLGFLSAAAFLFTTANWWWAVDNRRPTEDSSFLWDTGAAFDDRRYTHFGRRYRRRFVRGLAAFLGLLVVLLVLQVVSPAP